MTDVPDYWSIREEVEKEVREDFQKAYDGANRVKDEYIRMTEQWRAVVGRVQLFYKSDMDLENPEDLDEFLERLDKVVKLGLDFETLTKAVQTNELVKKQWDQMLMMMRLSGMDNSTSGSDNE